MTEPKEKAGKHEGGGEGGRKGRARCFGEGELFILLPQNSPRFAYGKALS